MTYARDLRIDGHLWRLMHLAKGFKATFVDGHSQRSAALESLSMVFRLGRYHDAAVSNVKAFNADLKLAQHCMEPYEPEHNTDMLIFAASMAGQV